MDILNISRLSASVDVRGHKVEVLGLEFDAIGSLVLRFPDLRKMIATQSFDIPSLLGMSGDVVPAIVAAGAKQISEDGARNLTFSEKVEILSEMAALTFTKGVVPFVESLAKFLAAASPTRGAAKASSTTSRKPSNT